MKIVILATLIAFVLAATHPVNHEIVAEIKAKATWTPMEPEENPFAYMSLEQIKAMMGTKIPVGEDTDEDIAEDLGFEPNDDFDARKIWGAKIHPIRDQGQCGSCWAFGATEALSDRIAIATNLDVILSPQYLVSCDKTNYGCYGGFSRNVWNTMAKTGVPTDTCYPYTSGTSGQAGSCKTACADRSKPTFYKSGPTTRATTVVSTQQAIQSGGPIEAAFTVYEDFLNYRSGVYQYTTGTTLGGHAIKCIGWGTENGVDYWLMSNSWGTRWGDNGFFKIKRGNCGSNDQMYFANAIGVMTTSE